ncbi:MAG: hypothetical protein Q7S27_07475 [Nanoarchaeota archaeon]|nr:hypothetical protein [Nanoarchaeota archaeon]
MEYDAEDGLKILTYLGYEITEEEKKGFRDVWPYFSQGNINLLDIVKLVYSDGLTVYGKKKEAFVGELSARRDFDFLARVVTTGLEEDLKNGIKLEEILKVGVHFFYKEYNEKLGRLDKP